MRVREMDYRPDPLIGSEVGKPFAYYVEALAEILSLDEVYLHGRGGRSTYSSLFDLATATARQRAEALLEVLSSSEPSPDSEPDV